MNAQDLLAELRFLRTTIERLLAQATPEEAGYRPAESMRTMLELANHLVQIPAIDLRCLREEPREAVQAQEQALHRDRFDQLLPVWDQGYAELAAHFAQMPEADFEGKVTQAFYGHAATQKKWLLDVVTHAYHHRAQLFTYLKLRGKPVDMFTLY